MSEKGYRESAAVVDIKDPPTAQERIAAAQKKRDEQRAKERVERDEQEAIDLEAIADLEAEHGEARIVAISIANVWKPGAGAPVRIAALVPTGTSKLAQRWIDQINRSKEHSRDRLTAQDALATECWLYPAKGSEGHKAALELAPLILGNLAVQIVLASQGLAEAEGKG